MEARLSGKEEVLGEKKSCKAKNRGEGIGNKYCERGKKKQLQEEKEKTNALVIQLNEMKQQLVNLKTRCDNFEKKTFTLNRFKNDKSMGFYTGSADGEIFDALYNFFYSDSGEDGENILS